MCEQVESILDQLPNELLLEILSHLDLPSLSNLMLSSRKYFHLITESNCLNKKFVLRVDRRKISKENCGIEDLSESQRNFHGFNVRWLGGSTKDLERDSSVASKNLWTIFQKFGRKLKKVDFGPGALNVAFLQEILNLSENVEEVSFMNSRFIDFNDFQETQDILELVQGVTLNKLKKLRIEGFKDERVFTKIFGDIRSLKSFTSNQDLPDSFNILRLQPDLQELVLEDLSGKLFGEDLTMNDLPFSLKKFQYCCFSPHLNIKHLARFLNTQEELVELKLELNFVDENLLKIILSKRLLTTLSLTYQSTHLHHSTNLPKNRSLHSLSLTTNNEESAILQENLVSCFTSLQSLKAHYNVNFAKDTKITFKNCPNLKKIEVDLEIPRNSINCLENFEIPSLEKFTVRFGKNSAEEWKSFLKNHPGIKYLSLVNCNLDDEVVLVVVESLKGLREFKCSTKNYEQLKNQLKLSQELLSSSHGM